ncbi:hypothetical protein FNV43_RR00466 [Rhamnella rubrinervis]|uniref:Uncharacterized protein n=1 Tax=Rhamnella rubrinervis TaxID=2594499 RepID=A0A8K0MRY5_9ROSA|nr:hypothetical protein FNV43_RR00466 [Rhamnella rubrinervis]
MVQLTIVQVRVNMVGTFVTSRGFINGSFVVPLNSFCAYESKLLGSIIAIECVRDFGKRNIIADTLSNIVVSSSGGSGDRVRSLLTSWGVNLFCVSCCCDLRSGSRSTKTVVITGEVYSLWPVGLNWRKLCYYGRSSLYVVLVMLCVAGAIMGSHRAATYGFIDSGFEQGSFGFIVMILNWFLGLIVGYCYLWFENFDLLEIMAFDQAWEIGSMQPSVSVNKLGLDLITGLNAGCTKPAKSCGIAGVKVEAVYNKDDSLKQPSFANVVNGSTNQVVPTQKVVVGGINYAEDRKWVWSHRALNLKSGIVCVGHSMAKCKSVIRKGPPKVGSHGKEKDNKAPDLTQVYKPKQATSMHVKSTTPIAPTINAFEVLSIDVTPTHIEDMVHQQDVVPTSMITLWAYAFSNLDDELDDYADDKVEDECPSLQCEGSSKNSNEIYGMPNVGQQLNATAMVSVPFDSSGLQLRICLWCQGFGHGFSCDLRVGPYQHPSLGHSVAKYKSVIGKAPPEVRAHGNEIENKASTQVYKPKQTPSQHVESTTPVVLTTNAFEVLNPNVTPTHIEDMVRQQVAVPSSMVVINTEIGIEAQPLALEVGKSARITSESVRTPSYHSTVPHIKSWANAFGNSDDKLDDYGDDRVEDMATIGR